MSTVVQNPSSKRKKLDAGIDIEDNLPLYVHYQGNSPKISEHGNLSTPVFPFISNKWNYYHLIHRLSEDDHICVKCGDKIKTGGCNDLSNSIKHICRVHPELAAWEDIQKPANNCTIVRDYKLQLERAFHKNRSEDQAQQETGSSLPAPSSALGFTVVTTSKRQKMIATQDTLVRAISRGFFALNFSRNAGGEVLLKWGNGGKMPDGVSRPAITRRAKTTHKNKSAEISHQLEPFKHKDSDSRPENNTYDEYLCDRLLCLQQDVWSNHAQDAFLGNNVTGITTTPAWQLVTHALGCTPFNKEHSSTNTLELTEGVLAKFGIKLTDLLSNTTDTASAAFNTFDPVDFIAQFPCFAHLIALLLKHAFEDGSLSEALKGIHDIVVLLRSSPKRKTTLQKACADAKIDYLSPIIDVTTRWCSQEAMVTRLAYLFVAIQRIAAVEAFPKLADRTKWSEALESAEKGLGALKHVLPTLVEMSQWTQVLSRRDSPTSSLVRFAARSTKRSLEALQSTAGALPHGLEKTAVSEVHSSISFWAFGDGTETNKGYIGSHYTDFWAFRVAELLDCRTYKLMSFAEQKLVVDTLMVDLVPTLSTTVPSRQTGTARRAMSEKEKFLNPTTASALTPLQEEFKVFINLMDDSSFSDPLEFYTMHQNKLPIFSAVARRVLAIPATSATTERLFSVGGRVCTFDRACLTPANVDILTTLHVWEMSGDGESKRAQQRSAKDDRFCKIKYDEEARLLFIEPGIGFNELDDDFEDDEDEDSE